MLLTDNDYPRAYGMYGHVNYLILQPGSYPLYIASWEQPKELFMWWSTNYSNEAALRACRDIMPIAMTAEQRAAACAFIPSATRKEERATHG